MENEIVIDDDQGAIEGQLMKNNINLNIHQQIDQHIKRSLENSLQFSFFMFVNPTSGGNKAGELLKLETEKITFNLDNPKEKTSKTKYLIDVYFIDLLNQELRNKGFNTLKQVQLSGKTQTRVVVCGGDGTIVWVIEEMITHQIDFNNCPIGIMAYGSGNDFSRVLGWGGDIKSDMIGKNLVILKNYIRQLIISIIEEFDIWDIKVVCYEDGCFKRIQNQNGRAIKVTLYEKDPKTGQEINDLTGKKKNQLVVKKHLSNYMSVGADARIGLGFDRHRTSSVMGNKCVYCLEGVKKLFMNTLRISQVIDTLEVLHQQDIQEQGQLIKESAVDLNIEEKGKDIQVLFSTKLKNGANNQGQKQAQKNLVNMNKNNMEEQKQIAQNDKRQDIYLSGDPICLIILNINSYSAGAMDMWRAARNKIGLEKQNKKDKVKDQFDLQKFGDGKIEFLTFPTILSVGQERMLHGLGKRVAQGSGPFVLKFRKSDERGQAVRTYFQIDGEYYQVISPKYIKIRQCKELPNGKIKVMVENQSRNTGQ